jgi:hypothetical protein
LDAFPPKYVRYDIHDYDFKADDVTPPNKIGLVVWTPDVSPAKRKMLATYSKASIKNALIGVACELQANDDSGIEEKKMRVQDFFETL